MEVPLIIIVSPWQQDIELKTKQDSSLWNPRTKPMDEKVIGQGCNVPISIVALVKNQVSNCYMTAVFHFNRKNLLVDYGTVT